MMELERYLQSAVEMLIEPTLERLIERHEAIPDVAQLIKDSFSEGRARPFRTQIVDATVYVAVEIPSGPHLFQSQRAQEMMRWLDSDGSPDLSPLARAATVPPALRERVKDFVATAGLELARTLFTASDLKGVALSLYEARTPKRLGGSFALTCVLSLKVDRTKWDAIPKQGPAEPILRGFDLNFAYDKDFSVRPSTPMLPPGHEQRLHFRGVPLWDLDADELQKLICDLFTRMGFLVGPVSRSRDKGIDLVVLAPPRSAGERFAVSAKSYLTRVGAPPVRELRDKIKPPRITGAVMMATSTYSEDALRAARGRPVKLISGNALKQLMLEYGLRWSAQSRAQL